MPLEMQDQCFPKKQGSAQNVQFMPEKRASRNNLKLQACFPTPSPFSVQSTASSPHPRYHQPILGSAQIPSKQTPRTEKQGQLTSPPSGFCSAPPTAFPTPFLTSRTSSWSLAGILST